MQDKRDLLKTYIISNVAPIMEDFIFGQDIPDSIIIDSKISLEQLYDESDQSWYNFLIKDDKKVLVIDRIDNIQKEEQEKFLELLKYRKVGTLNLPEDVVIIVTASKIDKDSISDEVYSLVAHIRG